ncbi:hypothetical protein VN97_g3335 [Penicillium thymicola]|uniref:Uncharacterized protein n=1 Tax=Penicillium thymicola TaxID=293382 RepID=A0AAI9TMI9_PENTH|nr:hypothetical protein VN97_g3335 [Penicillium thymicola]
MDRQFCRENLTKKDISNFEALRGSVLATAALTLGITFGNFHAGIKSFRPFAHGLYHTNWTIQIVSYRLYHTRLHKNRSPLTILDIPVRQPVTLCLYAPQYSYSVHCIVSYTMYPNVITALQHTSYTFVDPLGFWNPPIPGGTTGVQE